MAFVDFQPAPIQSEELQLTTVGRRTGRESSHPVWFVRGNQTLFLIPGGGADSQWYHPGRSRRCRLALATRGGANCASKSRSQTLRLRLRSSGATCVRGVDPGVDPRDLFVSWQRVIQQENPALAGLSLDAGGGIGTPDTRIMIAPPRSGGVHSGPLGSALRH
jgi:hypothetical protein